MPQTTSIAREATKETNDPVLSLFTLARWRLRQTGWLLLTACLGFVAAMIIACVMPLFTSVATVSGLQTIFQADPARNVLTLSINTQGLSSAVFSLAQQQVTPLVQDKLGSYQGGNPTAMIQETGIQAIAPASLQHVGYFTLYATPLSALKPSLRLISGHWPTSDTHALEIVLTPEAAQALHLSLGEQITLQGDTSTYNSTGGPTDPRTALSAQLVGLFEVNQPAPLFLHGQTFQPTTNGITATYSILTDSTVFLQTLDQMAARLHSDAIFSYLTFHLTWDYLLRTKNVRSDQVADLTNRLFTIQTGVSNYAINQQQTGLGTANFPYITQAALYSPQPGSFELLALLEQYTNRIALVSIPLTVLAILIIALLLFFVSMLVSMLLDRQMGANALLSSRGASGRQIFWSLFIQGLAFCVLGIVLGPLVGFALVSVLITHALPAESIPPAHQALTNPGQLLSSIGPTAGGTLLTALLTIGLIVRYTSGLNVLTLRQETARVTRPPFWQRYYLDVLAAVIALSAYGVSLYLASIAHEVDIATQDLILAPLTLVAPVFLLLSFLLIFLRIFPLLLRFGGWLANRRRGAISMLALVQMARAPRQIMRMTLLLSLTVAFAMFAQVFSASQNQRVNDVSAYEAGADFSGDIANQLGVHRLPLNQAIAGYRSIPGVLAASADYTDQGTTTGSSGGTVTIDFRAIDPQSFSQTVIWTAQDSSQSLPNLLKNLPSVTIATLPNGAMGLVIGAIVDQALASQLQLRVGSVFSSSLNNLSQATFYSRVIAIATHIPTVNSVATASSSDSPGGMLVDYQTFLSLYTALLKQQSATPNIALAQPVVPVNHIWLRTSGTPAALASVRAALTAPSSALALKNLYDRRQIVSELQSDPFNLNILVILGIGAFTAFLLALVGDLVSSWLSVRTRRASFVVLRALGANARQVAGILLWEQGIIYIGALVLGLTFGIVLTNVAVPVLVFTGLPDHGPLSSLSINDLYLLQRAVPAQIVVPLSLDLIFIALVLICIVALITMVRAALRPSLSNELRLSED